MLAAGSLLLCEVAVSRGNDGLAEARTSQATGILASGVPASPSSMLFANRPRSRCLHELPAFPS